MACAPQQSRSAKVGNEPFLVVKHDWTALEPGSIRVSRLHKYPSSSLSSVLGFDLQSKWPVGACKCSNQVGTARCKHVVHGVGRGNDALPALGCGASRQPAHNVAGFFVVERLGISSANQSLHCATCLIAVQLEPWSGDDVLTSPLKSRPQRYGLLLSVRIQTWAGTYHTEHVALFVLPALAVGNMRLNAEMEHGQVFDWILSWVQASYEPETSALVNVPANLVQLRTQVGKRKVFSRDEVAIQPEFYHGDQSSWPCGFWLSRVTYS